MHKKFRREFTEMKRLKAPIARRRRRLAIGEVSWMIIETIEYNKLRNDYSLQTGDSVI